MATYTAPTTRASGYLVTAANWNTDIVENLKYFKDAPTFDGAVTASSTLTVSGFGAHVFSAGGTGANQIDIRNTTAGTGNNAMLRIGNDTAANALELRALSSTYTTTGPYVANGVIANAELAGGLSIAATHASGAIRFYTGGATERARFDTSGNMQMSTNDAKIGWHGTPGATTTNYIQGNDATNVITVVAGGSGGVKLTSTATAWVSNSDERLKTDLVPVTHATDKLATARTVTGRYLTDPVGTSRAFLIAQDWARILPESVSVDHDGFLGLRYTETIPLLAAAINELAARIAALESK